MVLWTVPCNLQPLCLLFQLLTAYDWSLGSDMELLESPTFRRMRKKTTSHPWRDSGWVYLPVLLFSWKMGHLFHISERRLEASLAVSHWLCSRVSGQAHATPVLQGWRWHWWCFQYFHPIDPFPKKSLIWLHSFDMLFLVHIMLNWTF